MDLLARVQALAATEPFRSIAPPALLVLAERARSLAIVADQPISTQRDGVHMAVVLAAGELDEEGQLHRPGDVLGLIGVLAPTAPPQAAVARGPGLALELDADDVLEVLAEHPAAARALAARLAAVIRQAR